MTLHDAGFRRGGSQCTALGPSNDRLVYHFAKTNQGPSTCGGKTNNIGLVRAYTSEFLACKMTREIRAPSANIISSLCSDDDWYETKMWTEVSSS